MEAEEPPRLMTWRGGERRMRISLSEGQRLRVTGLSLADPAAARGQAPVTVWAEAGNEVCTIGTLSSEKPIAPVPPLKLAGDGEFVLRHDSGSSSVQLYGHYLDPPGPDGEGEPTRRRFLVDIDAEELGVDDDEVEVQYEYEPLTGGEDDDGEEEDQPLVST